VQDEFLNNFDLEDPGNTIWSVFYPENVEDRMKEAGDAEIKKKLSGY
jgi:hypothetical protein